MSVPLAGASKAAKASFRSGMGPFLAFPGAAWAIGGLARAAEVWRGGMAVQSPPDRGTAEQGSRRAVSVAGAQRLAINDLLCMLNGFAFGKPFCCRTKSGYRRDAPGDARAGDPAPP
jgi:hypothetical protein